MFVGTTDVTLGHSDKQIRHIPPKPTYQEYTQFNVIESPVYRDTRRAPLDNE